jgi:hypothetical protein
MLANVTTVLGIPELCAPLWEEKHGAVDGAERPVSAGSVTSG